MFSIKRNWSRRAFLAGTGAGAALLPFLPTLEAGAEDGAFPKRLLVFNTPLGNHMPAWRPTGTELAWELSPTLEPLAAFKDRMLVLDGLDNVAAYDSESFGHYGMPTMWTGVPYHAIDLDNHKGYPMGPSVDQVIAERIGGETPYSSLQFGVRVTNTILHCQCFSSGENGWIPPENDPREMYNRLFADFNLDPAAIERRKFERKSTIDFLKAEADRVQGRLGSADKVRLQAHLDAIHELEKRLDAELGANCTIPDAPDDVNPTNYASMDVVTDLQTDLIVNALSCDMTRVIGYQWGREGHTAVMDWIGHSDNLHVISHDPGQAARNQMRDANIWFATKLAELLTKLDSIPEGNGSLLDNCLVVWGSALSNADIHSNRNVPVVAIEGANGYFNTGRYLRWGDFNPGNPTHSDHGGQPMNKFLVSMCHAMGQHDIEQIGSGAYGTGPLDGLA